MIAKSKMKYYLVAFLLVAFAQLWFPSSMIIKYRRILEYGNLVKMKLELRDPVNPFKGKYLRLNFKENNFKVKDKWQRNEKVYVNYHLDADGYLKVDSLTKEKIKGVNAIKVKVEYYNDFSHRVVVKYPFDKYFLEESKALPTEQKIRSYLLRHKDSDAYAEISILGESATIRDIKIDSIL